MPEPWKNPFGGSSPPSPSGGSGGGGDEWTNPFASGGGGPAAGAGKNKIPEPTLAQTHVDPALLRETWDYKTAQTGMFGESLPDGAEGWTPHGTPYFGKGIGAKLKEYAWMFQKNTDAPTGDEWDNLKEKWKESFRVEQEESAAEGSKMQAGLALESVKMAWQAGTSDGSVVSPVLKLLGIGIKGLGDVFSLPSIGLKRAMGAAAAVEDAAEELGLDTLPDFMPETDNWFTNLVNETSSIKVGYAALKIAFSPRKDKWDVLGEHVAEGWDAGRIFYSGVYDSTIKEEYLRRYRAGEDPELLAMELENPFAELAGEMVFDPLNTLGLLSKAKTVDRVLDASEVAVKASGTLADTRAVSLLDEMGKLGKGDDLKAAQKFDEFSKLHMETVRGIRETKLTQTYTFSSLAANSNRSVHIREAQNFIGIVQAAARGAGRSFDEIAEFIKAGVMSVSDNADEVRAGVQGLAHFDAPKLMFSESGIKTFTMIRRMMTNEEGIVDAGKLLKLTRMSNPQDFMRAATEMLEFGAKSAFPTVDEMADAYRLQQTALEAGTRVGAETSKLAEQFKRLPKSVMAANFLDNKARKVYNPLNRVLGTFYFSLQGGVAVKNILNNLVQIVIDQGPKAFIRPMEFTRTLPDGTVTKVTRPAFWSAQKVEADLEKMLGFKPEKLTSGFSTVTDDSKGVKTIFAKLMDAGEKGAANRVVWSTMKDSMRKLMTERYLGSVEPLITSGMTDRQANHLMRLFYDNAGDIEKVKQEFRALYGSGSIDEWRTLDFLPKHYEDGFHELDIYDEIADFAKNGGKSRAEVEDFFQQLKDNIQARGAAASGDGARITRETPGFESFQKMEDAIHDGDLTVNAGNEILRTWLVASNEAKHQYMETLQDTIDWANRTLPQSQSVQLSNQMSALRKSEFLGKSQAEQKAMEIIDSARAWSQEIRNNPKPTLEWLQGKWREMGLNGEPFADLDKQKLQTTLWKYFRDQKGAVWQEYYGTVFKESRAIVEELGKVTDITPLKAKLTQAELAVERANALRSAIYRKGTFYAPPGKRDVYSLAHQFGVPTASESGRPNEKMVLNIINKYNGDPNYKLPKVGDVMEEVEIASDFERSGSPFSLIKSELGGIETREWAEIFGGRKFRDKKGVAPGLFTDKGGKSIDYVGRLLADYGFISEGKADDANYVREFLRAWADKDPKLAPKKTYIKYYTEDDIEAIRAGQNDLVSYDDEGNLLVPRRPNQQFTKVDEVPGDVALEAFTNWKAAKGEAPPDPGLIQDAMVPAYPSGSLPSVARAWNENTRPALYALDQTKNMILERYGRKIEGGGSGITPAMEKALNAYTGAAGAKIAEGKAIALKAAEHWRDFILHNYGAKTYGDLAWAYMMPYRFWYSNTYKNWMKRIVSDPHIIAGYVKYKSMLAKENSDKPEFYRGQLEVKGAFGIEFEHPLIFNLEAAINPLNGITGTDFTDQERRVNWWTSTLDDMGKFGPSLFAPLQWGIATALSMQGEAEGAQAWAGRAIPETAPLKSGLNWLSQQTGIDLPESSVIPGLKYGELDPVVNMFSGGLDKFERGRVGNALTLMTKEGLITEEQAIDASASQEGAIWDEAVKRASALRATSNLAAWGLGVGFKPRTVADQQIESMFTELNVLRTLNKDGRLTPDQYRQSMDAMREKYKFMDAVILSRRGGEFRDSAFAYNVLGRLPPGASRDVLMSIGLTDSDIQKFYESKGFTDKSISFSDAEKSRFMLAVTDLSAMLELPDYATRTEWNEAKTGYKELNADIAEVLGEDIWDKVSAYYDMRDVDPDAAGKFKDAHPEIITALQARQEGIVNDPLLFEYYSSIDKLEAYYSGKVRQVLFEKYGDTSSLWAEYYDLKLQGNTAAAKALWRNNPKLKAYVEEKAVLSEEMNRAFVEFAAKLPNPEPIGVRDDFTPQSGQQEQMFEAIQPENIPSWADVKGVVGDDLSPAMETLLRAYWDGGVELSAPAEKQLDYITSRYGSYFGVEPTNPDSMLRMLGLAMRRGSPQPGPGQPSAAGAGGWSNPFAAQ